MKSWELRRFVLNFFHFVFTVHDQEFPSIFHETYPDIDITEDPYLTDEMRKGVLDTIENHTLALTRASYDAVADYCQRLVMNSYNEEDLYSFMCLHARTCLFGNLDAASMIDELELVMNVLNDRIISKKFTSESWGKLNAAGLNAEKNAKMKRIAMEKKFQQSPPRLEASNSSSPSPEKPYEPVAKKPRTDLPSEPECAEMSEEGVSDVKSEELDILEETEDKIKLLTEESIVMKEENKEEVTETEESATLKDSDEKSETKKLKELKISKKSDCGMVSERITEPDNMKEDESETESKKSKESNSVKDIICEGDETKEPEAVQGSEISAKNTEECEIAQEIDYKDQKKLEDEAMKEDCKIKLKIEKSEMTQKTDDENESKKSVDPPTIQKTDDKSESKQSIDPEVQKTEDVDSKKISVPETMQMTEDNSNMKSEEVKSSGTDEKEISSISEKEETV